MLRINRTTQEGAEEQFRFTRYRGKLSPLAAVLVLAAGVSSTTGYAGADLESTPALVSPGAPPAASAPSLPAIGTDMPLAPSFSADVTVGLNFRSSLYNDASGSGYIPPDTMGAVGPDHIVEMINGNFQIFDKSTGASLANTSLNGFWTTYAGQTVQNTDTFDPRIVYDPASQRWFAVSIDRAIDSTVPPDGVYESSNNIYVARSNTSDPRLVANGGGGWQGVRFDADTVTNEEFHDYPTLGVDADGIYICTQDFGDGGHESCYSIPKAAFLGSPPSIATMTRFEDSSGLPTVSGSIQPAIDFGLTDGQAALLGSTGTALVRSNIFGANAAGATVGGTTPISGDPGHAAPPAMRQPDNDTPIENVAPRFVANVFEHNDSLWAVHAVAGSFSNSALRWYEIDESANSVIQTGLIEQNGRDFSYPSIATNDYGDVVIGYTCSGPNLYASTCVSVGATDPTTLATSFLPPQILQIGDGNYNRESAPNRNRWGDYSATVIDPLDACTLWTFQEFVADGATGNVAPDPDGNGSGTPVEGGLWGIQVTELTINSCLAKQFSDLEVTKTCKPDGTTPVDGVSEAECVITVRNWGPAAATGVNLTDRLTKGAGTYDITAITATQGTCTPSPVPPVVTVSTSPYDINCDIGVLAKDATATVTVKTKAASPIDVNDAATASSTTPDNNTGNNTATGKVSFVAPVADVVVTKTCKPDQSLGEAPFHVGDDTRGSERPYCLITATNHGPAAAKGVVLQDDILGSGVFTIPSIVMEGVSCSGVGGPFTTKRITCDPVASLAKDASITLKVSYNATQAVAINDTAEVTTTGTQDPDPDNNQAAGAVQILGTADLSITKSDSPDPVIAGQNLTYTLTVNNGGPSPAQGVVVTDVLPAGVSLVSVTPSGGTCGGTSTITCNLGTLANGASATITIVVKVLPETRGQLDNSAEVASSTYDWNNGNNKATASTTVTPTAGLSVTKTDVPDPVAAGAVLEYRLTVSNGGPSTATQVVLTDTLPSQVVFQSAVDGNGATICAHSAGQVTCNLGTLPPGAVVQVFIKVLVSASVPDGTTLTNTAKVVSFEDSTGATATAETLVNAVADLWLDKVSNFPTGNPSGTIVYNLYIYNKPGCEQNSGSGNVDPADCWNSGGGPSDAQNVVVTDTLPLDPKKFVVQYVSPNCVYDKVSVTHKVTCKVADTGGTPIPLPAGAVAGPFQIQAVVKGSNGTFTNTATVTSDTTDPNLVNNTDVVKTTVQGGTGKKGGGR